MITLESIKNLRANQLRGAALAFWGWWTGELRAMVPAHIWEMLQDRSGYVTVDILGTEIAVNRTAEGKTSEIARIARKDLENAATSASIAETLKKATDSADHIAVRLPDQELLRRAVKLPLGAARNLRNILKYELDRVSPLDPEQVYFDYRVLNRDKEANRLDIELRILKRQAADEAVTLCRSIGLEPATIGFLGDVGRETAQSFPVSRAASLRGQWVTWRVPALAALVVVLGMGMLLAASSRQQAAEDALADQIASTKGQAQIAERLQNKIDSAKLGMAFLGKQKLAPMLAKILAEVTHILPDGTWLVEFELHGREVRMRGLSPSASSLIALFDSSGFFTNAQFRAPLMQGSENNLERFDLSCEIKGGTS